MKLEHQLQQYATDLLTVLPDIENTETQQLFGNCASICNFVAEIISELEAFHRSELYSEPELQLRINSILERYSND